MPRPLVFLLGCLPFLIWPAIDYARWHRRGSLHH